MPLSDLIREPESTESYLKNFQDANDSADPYRASGDAFKAAMLARQQSDVGKRGPERDLNLRDAEHALFSQAVVTHQPVLGRLQQLVTVPGYSAAKTIAQTYPPAEPLVRKLTGLDLRGSTPPDLRELYWGLRPVFSSVRPKASSPPSGRGPDPEQP